MPPAVVAVRTPDPADIVKQGGIGGDVLATWRGADNSTHGQVMMAAGDNSLGFMAGYSWRDGEETDSAAAPHA